MTKSTLLICLIISVIISIPSLIGFFSTPENSFFITLKGEDEYNHLTWLYQAMRGHWTFWSPYVLEPHGWLFFQPLFLLEGKMAALLQGFFPKIGSLSLAPIYIYQFFRPVTAFFLLLSLWEFISFFIKNRKRRLFTFLFTALSGGVGWVEFFRPEFPSELKITSAANFFNEANTFWSMETFPHFSLSLSLMVWAFLFFLKYLKNPRASFLLLSGLSSFFLFLIHPFDFPTIYLVLTIFTFLSWKGSVFFTITTKKLTSLICLFLLSSPPLFYYLWLTRVDPGFAIWSTVKHPTPPLFMMLSVFGFLIPLSLLGTYYVIKKEKNSNSFLIIWAFSSWFLIYSPFHFQRRLVEGMHIPLAMLSASGLWQMTKCLKPKLLASVLILSLFFCSLSAPFFLYRDVLFWLRLYSKYYTLPRDVLQGLNWLSVKTSPKETVLGPPSTISFAIPALAGNQIFYGHWLKPEVDVLKFSLMTSFFSADEKNYPNNASFLNTREAKRFLSHWGIKFIFLDKEQFPYFDSYYPLQIPYLKKQFENKTVVIYHTNGLDEKTKEL